MEKKKQKIVSAVATMGIVLMLFGATYAYFASRVDAGKITDVEITANTVDVLTFETGDSISLSLDQESFAEGTGNKTGSTFAKATLSANNKTNTATKYYDLYLIILANTFEYSKSSEYPEIILSVKGSNNNELTEIGGLDYVSVTDAKGNTVKGFDITELNGAGPILANKEITAEPFNEENWDITVTYVNYDFDQSDNAGSVFKMRIIIEEAKSGGVCTSGQTLSSCIISKYGYDENLYYHSSDLVDGEEGNYYAYSGSNSAIDTYSCTYNGEDVLNASSGEINNSLKGDCNNVYKVDADGSGNDIIYFDSSHDYYILRKESVTWDEENSMCLTNSSKSLSFYFNLGPDTMTSDLCNGTAYVLSYSGNTLGILGVEEVGSGVEDTMKAYANGAGDGSYRYAGSSDTTNNFVCFGSDEETCPDDNLYRIIGVFGNQVKLIKWDYATSTLLGTDGDYKNTYEVVRNAVHISKGKNAQTAIGAYWWNYDGTTYGTNTWSASELNTVNLNTNYLNNIGTEWANMIDTTVWKVGGNGYLYGEIAANAYKKEYTNPAESTTETAKIGLMYTSDYGFAASPSAWTSTLDSYLSSSIISVNWMYMGLYEWTIVRHSADKESAFRVDGGGHVYFFPVGYSLYANAVRPVFYLESSVNYVSGDGSKSSPIRLS